MVGSPASLPNANCAPTTPVLGRAPGRTCHGVRAGQLGLMLSVNDPEEDELNPSTMIKIVSPASTVRLMDEKRPYSLSSLQNDGESQSSSV